MMFTDDTVICRLVRVWNVEEWWRYALKKEGMKVSRNKAEYMCLNESESGGSEIR